MKNWRRSSSHFGSVDCGEQPTDFGVQDLLGGAVQSTWTYPLVADNGTIEERQVGAPSWTLVSDAINLGDNAAGWFSSVAPGNFAEFRIRRTGTPETCGDTFGPLFLEP